MSNGMRPRMSSNAIRSVPELAQRLTSEGAVHMVMAPCMTVCRCTSLCGMLDFSVPLSLAHAFGKEWSSIDKTKLLVCLNYWRAVFQACRSVGGMRLVSWTWDPRNLLGYQSLQSPLLELNSSSVLLPPSTLHMLHAPSHILVPKNFHEGL
jgi:hypothetical protein